MTHEERIDVLTRAELTPPNTTLPAPGVLSITGERTELVVGESVVKVTVVGVVEHGFDALSGKKRPDILVLSKINK